MHWLCSQGERTPDEPIEPMMMMVPVGQPRWTEAEIVIRLALLHNLRAVLGNILYEDTICPLY